MSLGAPAPPPTWCTIWLMSRLCYKCLDVWKVRCCKQRMWVYLESVWIGSTRCLYGFSEMSAQCSEPVVYWSCLEIIWLVLDRHLRGKWEVVCCVDIYQPRIFCGPQNFWPTLNFIVQFLLLLRWGFCTSVWHSSRSAFGGSTGNDVSGHYKRHYFLIFFFSFLFLLRRLLFS